MAESTEAAQSVGSIETSLFVLEEAVRGTFTHNIRSLQSSLDVLSTRCAQLAYAIMGVQGRIIFTGVGKSAHIGRKLASTFASLGLPSFFMHSTEALHGDLGMTMPGDMVIALSKSGANEDLLLLLPILRQQGVMTVLFSCALTSLCEEVDFHLHVPCKLEDPRCMYAPTTSASLMLIAGDAIAVSIAHVRGYTNADFARRHPGGALGRSLLLTVAHLMQKDDLPCISADSLFMQVIHAVTVRRLGVAIVKDAQAELVGIITDGDLRRACELRGPQVFDLRAKDIMRACPHTITEHTRAWDALQTMRTSKITSLVVVDKQGAVVGLVHIHDILRAGIGDAA